jgi:2,4-dienoyl-CoA reductase-like NADH-dependent reductase (Old Yellow Enzyme family)
MSASAYPLLFSEWKLRNVTIPNRVVFAPTCPTWVANPVEGVFTDQAVAYYEERAASGLGLIVIGANMVDRSRGSPAFERRAIAMAASSRCSSSTRAFATWS